MSVEDRGDYDLTRQEWRRICGRRRPRYSEEEINHTLRFLRDGVQKKKIAFSLRLANATIIHSKINPFIRLAAHKRYFEKYQKDEKFRRRRDQSAIESQIRRKICVIARHLTREERVEFARDMGFSRKQLQRLINDG